MNIELKKATVDDIPLIQELSGNIWRQHYISIISAEQIEYMLQKMYAFDQLAMEIEDSAFAYYLAIHAGKVCGYIAISSDENEKYLLHKFYILQDSRYKGTGEKVFRLLFDSLDYKQIQLFVNRQNFKSINFYFKMGFKIIAVIDNHFGDGYYMNDFIMQKNNVAGL